MRRGLLLFLIVLGCCLPAGAAAGEAGVFTLWPLIDYRSSAPVDYRSYHLLGPLFKHEVKQDETETALRPLVYHARDDAGAFQTEVLYPLMTVKGDLETRHIDVLHLLNYDFGKRESGSSNNFYLFPLVFYGKEPEPYFAVFPLGGRLLNWFDRDEIDFALFPLYSHTRRGTTEVDNLLWPIFARIRGERESGYKVWPIYGHSRKDGVYDKQFLLWPIFFREDLALDTANPVNKLAALPFYLGIDSPASTERHWLWPFFSWRQDRARDYEEWNTPWPLVRFTRGEDRHGLRLLPLYSDETVGANRKRWIVWPAYKIETTRTEQLDRSRHRVLFFLYSDLHEQKLETGQETRRVSLWPVFTYSRKDGASSLRALSLLEPLFPENQAIERSWSPLWSLYQQRWDAQGNQVVSLFWNLYWHERQGDNLALELFPLIAYRREVGAESTLTLLKGLVSYRSSAAGNHLNLFYLPWGIPLGKPRAAAAL